MNRTLAGIAAIFGFLGVALGAFGTHGLAAVFAANGRADTFGTASQYHLIHTVALLFVALAEQFLDGRFIRWAGYCFIAGVILFSGSLYVLAVFDLGFMGAIAPLGGAAFLAGWGLLGYAAWNAKG